MSGAFLASYVVLWALVAVLAIAVFALYHHFGQMYIESREGRSAQGPDQGRPLPEADARTIAGESTSLPPRGVPALLVFAKTDCAPCEALLPELGALSARRRDVRTVLVCAGPDASAVAAWSARAGAYVTTVVDRGQELAAGYRIGVTPFVVAVDGDGLVQAKGLVSGPEVLDLYVESVAPSATTPREEVRDEAIAHVGGH